MQPYTLEHKLNIALYILVHAYKYTYIRVDYPIL